MSNLSCLSSSPFQQALFKAKLLAFNSSLSNQTESMFYFLSNESLFRIPLGISWLVTWILPASSCFLEGPSHEPSPQLFHIELDQNPPPQLSLEEQEQFLYVVQKIRQFRQEHGLQNALEIFYDEKVSSCSVSYKDICFGRKFLRYERQSLDFFLAHEFSHLTLGHTEKKMHLHLVIALTEVIASFVFSPLIIIPIEMIAFIFLGFLWRYFENQADQRAIQLLGTSEGARIAFKKLIDEEWEMIAHLFNPNSLSNEQMEHIKENALNYFHYSHPNPLQRLKKVSEFV